MDKASWWDHSAAQEIFQKKSCDNLVQYGKLVKYDIRNLLFHCLINNFHCSCSLLTNWPLHNILCLELIKYLMVSMLWGVGLFCIDVNPWHVCWFFVFGRKWQVIITTKLTILPVSNNRTSFSSHVWHLLTFWCISIVHSVCHYHTSVYLRMFSEWVSVYLFDLWAQMLGDLVGLCHLKIKWK